MKNLKQTGKLIRISFFILKQYGRIFTDYKSVQGFFTELYIKSMNDHHSPLGSKRILPAKELNDIVKGIDRTNIFAYAEYRSLSSNTFNDQTAYLVSPQELFALNALIKFTKPASVLEIGTYKGSTTANFILNLPQNCKLTTIDMARFATDDQEVTKLLERPDVERIIANSHTFDWSSYTDKIDFIFIDACHSAESVKIDSENALKILSSKGFIIWHDYNEEFVGVLNYLNELSKSIRLTRIKNTALVVYGKAL
jgi:hypothetical protein